MAGVGRMRLWPFLAWDAAGALAWALLIGLLAYYLGAAVVDAIQRDVFIGTGVVAAIAVVLVLVHFARRRFEQRL